MPRQSRAQGLDFDIHNDPACSGPSMEDEYRYEDADESVLHHYDDEEGDMSHVDGGDNSSHHDNEDDVFSDNSPRSSMGSVSEGAPRKSSHDARSPRISDIQQYETEADFVPTAKGAPRPPFRSPSSVKAMQMNSPAPSVSGGQPRSGRRSALPTVSRIGSPGSSQPPQYSPKKTPPRFKKNDPPLVLLHVTLLPLRWPWGEVLDEAKTSELSEGVKTLREAWRELQDTIGDTIQDRGVLLPHPQNDFEVMEERLLEALELPFKRRARILECGHYLGPSNEMPFADEHDSDDDDAFDEDGEMLPSNDKKPTHWCTTCSSEIPVDALGAGKIYRVKVYASNGLMRAGAWEACWKEMERVDIELEPMMDAKLQDELVHLAARQDRVIHSKSRAGRRPISSRIQDVEDEREDEDFDDHVREETMNDGEESFMDEKAHRRQTSYDTTSSGKFRQHSARTSMGGRSSMGFAPQEESAGKQKRRFNPGSFPDVVVNAFKALLDDKRNLAILLLSALTVVVALRGGVSNRLDDVISFQPVVTDSEVPTAVLKEGEGEGIELEGEAGAEGGTSPVDDILFTPQVNIDGENPCPAVEPQTVEKWMTATVTEMSTVARTDMPLADSDFSSDDDDDEDAIVDKMLAGETLTLGENYVEDEEEMHGQGHSSWEWGSPFKFPW
ncbi:uncharacterized protein TrAFT101_004771 [Trichoderma asperellum]|uniref:Pathway-specific nitrogen regulator n=1 Tax=Trichoderma asperellum (strain ATCC 204424 / CBS 433.97 / NBRC 101777) TaxID=1042311 RepID=A0A2T3Z5U8_TRIA4|nr:hypothetical protein M441DRAFT_58999 [Trichoderma asperellum CBS 433.97]PTB40183.1 hypothetical protein M441DRAFT_58999 [Trichoderma asperellum CBS 433.97]UKZ89731.1 hypothetical protein TrAFT101_004771 [Trichoderma asperellum]